MAPTISQPADRLEDGAKNAATPSDLVSDLPAIVVHDDTEPLKNDSKAAPYSPSSATGRPDDSNTRSPPFTPRSESFTAITTPIPTGSFDDPFSSQIQFSSRGSVQLGTNEANTLARALQKSSSVRETQQRGSAQVDNQRRVSADERRLSRQVRSLYEPDKSLIVDKPRFEHASAVSVTLSMEDADIVPEMVNTRLPQALQLDNRSRESPAVMRNETQKDANVAAGGIEDWTDVDSRDVDRWGFIKPRSTSSKRSSVVSTSSPGCSDHQRSAGTGGTLSPVAETHAENGQSQRKRNRLSLNPGGKTLKSSPSVLSSRSKRSTTSRIASLRGPKSRPRWLIDAPDMLLPPPGLGDDGVDPHLDHAREARRADKWHKMARQTPGPTSSKGAGTHYVFNTSDPKLVSRVWKGIPDRWRSAAWYAFLASSAARRSPSKQPDPPDADLEDFFHRCQEDDCADDVQIDMDVPRTIGNHLQFRKRYHGGQRFLFRVLRALSLYFPETGYVQGMASVVATLLVYYEESRAFVMAVRLWQLRGVRKLYSDGFEGLLAALQELEGRWLRGTALIKHLETLGINASAWGPKWYLTLFNYVLPFHTMLRIWDVLMLLDDPPPRRKNATAVSDKEPANFDVLHCASAAILAGLRDMIVDADFENAMKALTSPVRLGKDDKLMLIARKMWEDKKGKR